MSTKLQSVADLLVEWEEVPETPDKLELYAKMKPMEFNREKYHVLIYTIYYT